MKRLAYITFALFLTLAGCQEEMTDEPCNPAQPDSTAVAEGAYTTFAASQGGTRTSMRADGQFSWTVNDNIFVKNDAGSYVQANSTDITTTQTDAEFNFTGDFSHYSYPVRYTGTNNTYHTRVTISPKQIQSAAGNADHFGTSGDCGVATAIRKGDHYEFTLEHKASYLVLNPVTASTPMVDYCYLLGVTVTDLSSNTLCGTYDFDDNGLGNLISPGSSTITLKLDNERLTPVDNYSALPWWKDETGEIKNIDANFHLNKSGLNTAYIVMQPGQHQLRVTYKVAYFRLQETEFDGDRWKFKFVDNVKDYSITYPASEYKPGYFYTMMPTLDLSPQEPMFQYNYSGYHQWDAPDSYWDFLTNNPTTDSRVPRNNNESASFLRTSVENSNSFTPRNEYNVSGYVIAQNVPFKDVTPNANEMTWYIMAGDVHRDAETLWWMHGFHNQYTLCKDGVWIKKRQYITDYTDTQTYNAGDGNLDLTKDDRPAEAVLNKFRTEFVTIGDDDHKHRPADSEIDKYFFLPDRGYYMTSWDNEYPNYRMELKLMGAEGFYWTSTAIKDYDDGKTRRHAYALEINDRGDTPYIRLKYKDIDAEQVMRRYGFIAGYRPYTDPPEPWFQ